MKGYGYTPCPFVISCEKGLLSMSPSYNHSYLTSQIAKSLDQGNRFNIHVELTLDINGKDYIPDIALYEQHPIDYFYDNVKTFFFSYY